MGIPKKLDYNKAISWFSIPEEYYNHANISQSSPSSISSNSVPFADVFFVHGTVLEGEGKTFLDPRNQRHRELPLYPRMAHASCFEKNARIFQPHYRQASLETHFDSWDNIVLAYKTPFDDIIAAYTAYMTNWNMGRPVIFAGNSQGSILILELLKHLYQSGKSFDHLIAAYIIGFTVTPDDLIACGLPLSQHYDDTKCIITYNSLAQGANQGFTLLPNALCTNPLNWRTDSEYADKSLHLGRVNIQTDGTSEEIPHFTDAWIDTNTGGLIVGAYTLENTPPRQGFPRGDLHSYNYALFYRNLEENALMRAKAYHKKNQLIQKGDGTLVTKTPE